MKRRKINIILSVFSIIISLSLFGFGVYAASTVTSTVNNTFMFNIPEDAFFVDIVGSITGCKNEENFSRFLEHSKDSQVFDKSGLVAYPGAYEVEFVEEGNVYKDIIFSFTIKNYNTYPIRVSVLSNTNSANFSNTPSAPVVIDAYTQGNDGWVYDEQTITVVTKLTTDRTFVGESNSFTINFELL